MTTTAPSPATHKPWRSGFCGLDLHAESHARCAGSYDDTPCRCACHNADRLLAHVRALREAADAVLTFDLNGIGWEDAVRIGHEMRMAKGAIAAAEEFNAKHAGEVWPSAWKDQQVVEGVGTANPYRTRNTTWDIDDVVKEVVDRHMAELEGEIPDPMTVARWLMSVAHVDYFRTRKLEDLAIDVDEYRHTTYGTVRLGIKSRDHIGATTEGDKT